MEMCTMMKKEEKTLVFKKRGTLSDFYEAGGGKPIPAKTPPGVVGSPQNKRKDKEE